MRIARQLAGILATGYILVYYSEFLFWAWCRLGDFRRNGPARGWSIR